MDDLDSLRGRTWSPPPPGALEAVVTAGRWRRRRLASGTSLLTAAGLVLALQIVPSANQAETLLPAEPVTSAPAEPTPSPMTSPSTHAGDQPLGTTTATTIRSSAPRVAGAPSTDVRSEASSAGAAETRSEQRPPGSEPRISGPRTSKPIYDSLTKYRAPGPDPTPCEYSGPRASICAAEGSDADVGPASDGERSVGYHHCNAGPRSRTLKFGGEQELALTIRDVNNNVVWQWRPSRDYRTVPHNEVVTVDECLFWTTNWRQVNDQGRPVPTGAYTLHVDFLEASSHGRSESRTFTVTR